MDDGAVNVSGLSRDELGKIGPAMQGVIDQGLLSGVVTLLWRNGEIAQVTTNGLANRETRTPMASDTIFRIASMTKPITSVAALMLMEEGKLRLDDPITRWLPEFANMQVLKDPQGPVENTYRAPRDITVEDLMTHRAGLAYGFTSVGPIAHAHQKALGDVLNSDMDPDAWLKALGGLPLSYPPGERFHYSHATDVLGYLVGRIEGKPFRDVLFERIFNPLGMVDTDFWIPPEKAGRAAVVYRINAAESGKLDPVAFKAYTRPPAFTGGGGGLASTADDYLKFARMLLNKGEVDGVRLLKPETVELMQTNRLTDAQRAIPFMGFPFWMGQGFGLGVSVILDAEKQAWMGAGSNGAFSWPGAFGTWWRGDPKENMVMLYMIQNSMELGPEAASQLATGQRMAAQAALPMFQNLTYGAIQR
ncbi:MAG TPA: serine hydrolase domain-containing protein [Caulobacteraceae bacterium]|jgi:CubicO group peptidase (beta-lactamase class C family)|nr:serine hydrolase domain-containing protein [Caulobacteraceae bacterium]